MYVALRIKLICKQKRNDVIQMTTTYSFTRNAKIARRVRRNNTQRANTRANDLNALQRHITRAHDAKTNDARRDAIEQINFALINVLNDVI